MNKSIFKREHIGKLERKNLPWVYMFLLPCILVFLFFYLWPILTVMYTSFTIWNGFTAPIWLGSVEGGRFFDNFARLFTLPEFTISLRNLLLWSVIATTFHVGFGVLAALIFYKGPPGWKFTRAMFMIPNIISVAAWALIYRYVFHDNFGLLNNIIRIFSPDFTANWFFASPYAFWAITFTWVFYSVIVALIVLSDLMAIPTELQEAARIDGATGWGVTWRVNLPLCRFSIGTSIILSITARITMYEAIWLTTRGGPGNDTMSLPIVLVRNLQNHNLGMANAIAFVMLILGVAVMLIVRKSFRMEESVY